MIDTWTGQHWMIAPRRSMPLRSLHRKSHRLNPPRREVAMILFANGSLTDKQIPYTQFLWPFVKKFLEFITWWKEIVWIFVLGHPFLHLKQQSVDDWLLSPFVHHLVTEAWTLSAIPCWALFFYFFLNNMKQMRKDSYSIFNFSGLSIISNWW